MLKTVSSITNAIGALNYKGTWDANANSPALTSSVGTKGDYYVVGTAGSTNLNGISNWGVGDWAAYNGSVWQRVEGGANLNGVDLSVSGTSTLSGLTASTALALNGSKQVVSVTNTGTGNNVLATSPTIDTPTSNGSGGLASRIHTFYSAGYAQEVVSVNAGDVQGWNGNGSVMFVAKINGNGRSLNAGGTLNANGTDYAEYMTKAGNFTIAKGDICGIDANGKITNKFGDSIAFVVKSTNPSYVGGDAWGSEDALGVKFPAHPKEDASKDELEKYIAEKNAVDLIIESARQKVDRIAFAGQVPVNVFGAIPGQYIVPEQDEEGIKGIAVSDPTFEQYKTAIGKVIAVEADGRARIIVKIF